MARVKTNRTNRATFMLSDEALAYLIDLAESNGRSVSAIADQVCIEHKNQQASFFEADSTKVEYSNEVELFN